jgi:hypothetical protein
MMRLHACAIALFLSLAGNVALAQDPQKVSAAQVLFDDAMAQMSRGEHAAACPKLEEAQRQLPEGLGIKEQLGFCYEGAGRLASAWSQWRVLEDLAGKANQATRMRLAVQRAAALRPRLATLTVEVPAEAAGLAGLVVKRDGIEVGSALWGTEVPVDKGAHEVYAVAPGYTPFRQKVEVAADGAKVSVRIPVLGREAGAPATPDITPEPAAKGGWQRPVGIVGLVVGAAGVAAGAVLGGLAIAKKDESNAGPCMPDNQCTQEGVDLRKEARFFGDVSTVAIIAGGVLAAGGLTLVLVAPDQAKPGQDPVTARLRAVPGGLFVDGRF